MVLFHSTQESSWWSLSEQQQPTTQTTVDHGDELLRLLQDTTSNAASPSSTNYNDGQVLKNTFLVFGTLLVIILLLFGWARRRFPQVYNLRRGSNSNSNNNCKDDDNKSSSTALAQAGTTQHGFVSWVWKVHNVTDDAFMNECGMDALCSARVLRVGFKLRYVLFHSHSIVYVLFFVIFTFSLKPKTSLFDTQICCTVWWEFSTPFGSYPFMPRHPNQARRQQLPIPW
jgi:Late exocytosis, associated with Golgi transport